MANLLNSHSLSDFQRNARAFIDGLNQTHEPVLLTVNGKVQAVLVDPATFQDLEARRERQCFLDALREGESAIAEGRVRTAEAAYDDMKAKYGL